MSTSTKESITDPAHDLSQKGIVILTRGENAFVKDAVRLRIAGIESWLFTYDPPDNPWLDRSKNAGQVKAYRSALLQLKNAQTALACWLGAKEERKS